MNLLVITRVAFLFCQKLSFTQPLIIISFSNTVLCKFLKVVYKLIERRLFQLPNVRNIRQKIFCRKRLQGATFRAKTILLFKHVDKTGRKFYHASTS